MIADIKFKIGWWLQGIAWPHYGVGVTTGWRWRLYRLGGRMCQR